MKKLLKDERVINFGEELIEVKDRFIGKSFDITLVPQVESIIGADFKDVKLTDIKFIRADVRAYLGKAIIEPVYMLIFGDKKLNSSLIKDIKYHLTEEDKHYKELVDGCKKVFYSKDIGRRFKDALEFIENHLNKHIVVKLKNGDEVIGELVDVKVESIADGRVILGLLLAQSRGYTLISTLTVESIEEVW